MLNESSRYGPNADAANFRGSPPKKRDQMKGYWIVLGSDIADQQAQHEYAKLWTPLAAKYGAQLKALDAPTVLLEVQSTRRLTIVEFPTYEQAKACYADPAYVDAKVHALNASEREVLLLKGDLAFD
jgi:uncharacterized protein (DUF1330 family)